MPSPSGEAVIVSKNFIYYYFIVAGLPGGGALPYVGYTGTCHPFRVSFFKACVHSGYHFHDFVWIVPHVFTQGYIFRPMVSLRADFCSFCCWFGTNLVQIQQNFRRFAPQIWSEKANLDVCVFTQGQGKTSKEAHPQQAGGPSAPLVRIPQ